VWAKTSHLARTAGSLTETTLFLTSTTRPIRSGIPHATHAPEGARSRWSAMALETPALGSSASEALPLRVSGEKSPDAGPSFMGGMTCSFVVAVNMARRWDRVKTLARRGEAGGRKPPGAGGSCYAFTGSATTFLGLPARKE